MGLISSLDWVKYIRPKIIALQTRVIHFPISTLGKHYNLKFSDLSLSSFYIVFHFFLLACCYFTLLHSATSRFFLSPIFLLLHPISSSIYFDYLLGYLKKQFNALLEIKQKGSGFGWDDKLKMVTGDRKLFEEWAKSHKDAKGLYRKPFPLFDDLEEIFAKDRATGLKSAMPVDRDDQEVTHQDATHIQENKSTEVSSSNQAEEVPIDVCENAKRVADEGSCKRVTKKKLKTNKDIQTVQKSLENMMSQMIENSNAQLDKLVNILEGPKNLKVGLREELGNVPGISRNMTLTLCLKMSEDEIVIFRDLADDDDKYDFLTMILEKS